MNVQEYLASKNVPFEVLKHQTCDTAHQLAHSVHVAEHAVAKTVMLKADRGYAFIVAIVPSDCDVDLDKVGQALGGSQIEMATEEDIDEHCPECAPGMLPPFGSNYELRTIVDQSLAEQDEIVFGGCSHEEAIRMRFEDFQQLEEPLIVPIAKDR